MPKGKLVKLWWERMAMDERISTNGIDVYYSAKDPNNNLVNLDR